MNPLHSLTHDGPAPLAVRGFIASRFAGRGPCLAAVEFKGGGATTSQTQTTATTDNRVATDGDGNQIYHGNEIGGSLVFNTLADDVALGAFDAATELGSDALDAAQGLTDTGANTTLELARGALDGLKSLLASSEKVSGGAFDLVSESASQSAASARQVADSQKEFLRAQTGQDSVEKLIRYGLTTLAVGGIVAAIVVSRKSK